MASTAPGAKAIITSATGSDKMPTSPTANTAVTATATANEPKAAPRKCASSRSGVPAKREPVTAPNAIITVLATHHGITT